MSDVETVSYWWRIAARVLIAVLAFSLTWSAFWFFRGARLEGQKNEWMTACIAAVSEGEIWAGKYMDERNRNAKLCNALEITSRATLTALVKLSVEAGMPYTPDEIRFIKDSSTPVSYPDSGMGGAISED